MKYQFPIISKIDDVLPVIKDKKEFIVVDKGWYTVINYAVQTEDTFPKVNSQEEAILRECRGIIFDKEGKILSRPLHKFFNLKEREETQIENIDMSIPHWRLEKIDGSMIWPLYMAQYDGFRLASKMGITDVAMQAEVYIASHPEYFKLFRFLHAGLFTPIFEWISPQNRIVIDYKKSSLILLAIRATITGEYLTYDELIGIAASFNIPVVQAFSPVEDLASFAESVREEKGNEGYVIRFLNGHMLKVKADEYLLMHKSKDIVSSDRKIIQLILEDQIDDLKPSLFKEDLEKVNAIQIRVALGLLNISDYLKQTFSQYKGMERKEFALLSQTPGSGISQFQRWAIFKLMDGRTTPINLAKEYVSGYLSTDSKFGMLKNLVPQFGF